MNQFMTAVEKIAAMQAEEFFLARRNHADREAFRRILNRQGGEPPRPDDQWPESNASPAAQIARQFTGKESTFSHIHGNCEIVPFCRQKPFRCSKFYEGSLF